MPGTMRLTDMAAYLALRDRDVRRIDSSLKETLSQPPSKLEPRRNPRGRHKRGEMNKAEESFSMHLDVRKAAGVIKGWKFEEVTLTLADRCTYTPDFLVEMSNGDLVFYEVKKVWKGKAKPHYEDDAKVKIKVAAKDFRSWFTFYGVHFDGSQWVYEIF